MKKLVMLGAAFVAAALYLHRITLLMTYVDTKAYRELAAIPVGKSDFWYGIRPPVVPLLLKLSPDNATIARLQLALYIFSALALAAAAWRWMRRLKLTAAASVLVLALLPHHFLWCSSISSESLTFSFWFLLLALGSLLVRPPQRRGWQLAAAVGFALVTLLFVFTRDANGYLLVFVCALVLTLALYRRDRPIHAAAALSLALLLTMICAHTATRGQRWKWPFVNILGQRVLWRPDRAAFFHQRGMPINRRVMCFAKQWGYNCSDDLTGFGDWLDRDIKQMYEQYLLAHPVESAIDPFRQIGSTLYSSDGHKGMFFYFHPTPGWYEQAGRLWFQNQWTMALLAIACLLGVRRLHLRGELHALVPAMILCAAVPLMLFFVWHGDAAEPMRHALIPTSLLRLAMVFGILSAYD